MPEAELLEIGRVAKPHGLRGEVIVELTTDRTERLDAGTVLHGADDRSFTVVRAAPHQRRWRVAFEGIASREDAEAIHGARLYAEAIDDPDAWFVHELIGQEVVTVGGESVGRCTAVIDNPAHDLLEVDGTLLVPLPFVVERTEGRLVIDPPPGLLNPE